jgi:hypothetical protein
MNAFSYETRFFGYTPGAGSFRIVCDEKKNEVNFVKVGNETLVYMDGENPRSYYEYAGAQLGNQLYFLSERCNDWVPSTCGSMTYQLFECDLGPTSCDPLPILYTEKNVDFLVLEANETDKEINLYKDDFGGDGNTLIFTWGEQPRCHAEGCEILEK